MNHTPGPWTVGAASWSEDGNAQYELVGVKSLCAPDARLIAAAPELLAALEEIIDDDPARLVLQDHTVSNARAAIKKARGE